MSAFINKMLNLVGIDDDALMEEEEINSSFGSRGNEMNRAETTNPFKSTRHLSLQEETTSPTELLQSLMYTVRLCLALLTRDSVQVPTPGLQVQLHGCTLRLLSTS